MKIQRMGNKIMTLKEIRENAPAIKKLNEMEFEGENPLESQLEVSNYRISREIKQKWLSRKIQSLRTEADMMDFVSKNSDLLSSNVLVAVFIQYLAILKIQKRADRYIDINAKLTSGVGYKMVLIVLRNLKKMKAKEVSYVLEGLIDNEYKAIDFWREVVFALQKNQRRIFKDNYQSMMKIFSKLDEIFETKELKEYYEEMVQVMITMEDDKTFKTPSKLAAFVYYNSKVESKFEDLEMNFELDDLVRENIDKFNLATLAQILNSGVYKNLNEETIELLREKIQDKSKGDDLKSLAPLLRACCNLDLRDPDMTEFIIQKLRKNIVLIEDSEDKNKNIKELLEIYGYLTKMSIFELETFQRIEVIVNDCFVNLDSKQITFFIKNHCDLLFNLRKRYLNLEGKQLEEKDKIWFNHIVRKMNFEFWDDMIFLIGPRLNEFNVQQINQLLSGASRPKIGKKSVQRILVAFVMQGVDLLSEVKNKKQFDSQFNRLVSTSDFLFQQKSLRELITNKIESKIDVKSLGSSAEKKYLQLKNN